MSTSPARLSPSIANLAASPFQSHTLLMSLCVKSVKPVAMYLPHEWFAWLEMEEQAAGFDCLERLLGKPQHGRPKAGWKPSCC